MADRTNRSKIEITGEGKSAIDAFKKVETQARTFENRTIATFRRVNSSIQGLNSRMVNGLTAIGVGFGASELIKNSVEWEATLRRIGRTGGYTAVQMEGLRRRVLGLIDPAAKVKIALGKEEWTEGASALSDLGVRLNVIEDILPRIGKGAVAAHVGMGAYSEAIGEFLQKYHVAVADLPALQEQLNRSMKFEDIRKNPEEFLQAMTALAKPMQIIGATGLSNVTPLIAAMAQIAAASGNAGEAGTSMEALLNGLFRLSRNKNMLAGLHQAGVNFFNPDRSLKGLKDILPEIKKLGDEAQKHGMDIEGVAMNVFGRPEAGKAVMMIAKNYDEIVAKEKLLQTSTGDLERDFMTESTAMSAKVKELLNEFDSFKTNHMQTALKGIAFALDELNAHPVIAKGLIASLIGVGGIMVIEKVASSLKGMGGFLKDIGSIWGGGKAGGKLGEALGKTGGAIPVFVTNWGGVPGGAPGGPGPGKSVLSGMWGFLGALGGTAIASIASVAAGATAWTLLGEWSRRSLGDRTFEAAMRAGSQQNWGSLAPAHKNEINLYFEGALPTAAHGDPTDLNTTVNLKRGRR